MVKPLLNTNRGIIIYTYNYWYVPITYDKHMTRVDILMINLSMEKKIFKFLNGMSRISIL